MGHIASMKYPAGLSPITSMKYPAGRSPITFAHYDHPFQQTTQHDESNYLYLSWFSPSYRTGFRTDRTLLKKSLVMDHIENIESIIG